LVDAERWRNVKYLTKQEQIVLCLILALVLMGWAVKSYRTTRRAAPTVIHANS
jgi:hypothetical protein